MEGAKRKEKPALLFFDTQSVYEYYILPVSKFAETSKTAV